MLYKLLVYLKDHDQLFFIDSHIYTNKKKSLKIATSRKLANPAYLVILMAYKQLEAKMVA